ncbi:thermonuclease family protein [Phenylobacterium sp.]|uniref:thermonuclease family protein n=1 Tax=Phenylobacterium sp. TaxID=1871053 RepID=UPI002732185E|nr:thermonuclease family protein [Phenylobacterium sp.]MDP1875186.1 thermonuclease family protein [Phenylobacterium sp.]
MTSTRFGGLAIFILVIVAVFLEVVAAKPSGLADPEGLGPGQAPYVIDGDTLRTPSGDRVRLVGIDAPEMPPRAGCDREIELAFAAKARLTELIKGAERIEYLARPGERDRDRYDRLLRDVRIDGVDAGHLLVSEGLAKVWRGQKSQSC